MAREYPFQRVIGVEISAQLSEIARSNVERYRPRARQCWNVDVQAIDATKVDFPDTDLLVHLYHPFEAAITSPVRSRLLKRRRYERSVLGQYNWLVYSAE